MQKIILLLTLTLIFTGCKKTIDEIIIPLPSTTDDARTVLLKDVVSGHLPNPYFHFNYDSMHYVKQISFASGLNVYVVEYENKRVSKMTNINNGHMMYYTYANNNVSEINEFDGTTGDLKFRYKMTYDNSRLIQVSWYGFVYKDSLTLFKKQLLAYQADGNLSSIDYFNSSTGELLWSSSRHFSNYDSKTNVDDFYLLEGFFDTFLFLPQVKFQKNNPQEEVITGGPNKMEISYTYTYKGNLPEQKTGIARQVKGANEGQVTQIVNFFNYY